VISRNIGGQAVVLSSYTHLQLLQPVFTLGRLALRDFTGLLFPSLSAASVILRIGTGAGHLHAESSNTRDMEL
jgi:hypothetical protein